MPKASKYSKPAARLRDINGKPVKCIICGEDILLSQADANKAGLDAAVSLEPKKVRKRYTQLFYHMRCEIEKNWPRVGNEADTGCAQ